MSAGPISRRFPIKVGIVHADRIRGVVGHLTGPSVIVRAAVPADVAAMAALHVRAWRATYAGLLPDEFLAELKVEEREARWRQSVTAPEVAPAERVILVAERAGTVVGFVAAGHARGDDEFGLGEVYAINVDPPAWRQGAGR